MAKIRRPPPDLLKPELLLGAYAQGCFPMADERDDDDVFFLDPDPRGILPLDAFHVPRRLARTLKATAWRLTADAAFDEVIAACAEMDRQDGKTWINRLIERSYCNLHRLGHAHSIEVWEGEALVGGLYGVTLGAAFFGESMFSRQTDASKIALAHLAARLKAGRFRLLDTQFVTAHLKQFGAVEISRARYHQRLRTALAAEADFYVLGGAGAAVLPGTVLQLITQTS